MQAYQIGRHVFFSPSFLEATADAIQHARALFRDGNHDEATDLFETAHVLRRLFTYSAPQPSRPHVSLRATSRFRRA